MGDNNVILGLSNVVVVRSDYFAKIAFANNNIRHDEDDASPSRQDSSRQWVISNKQYGQGIASIIIILRELGLYYSVFGIPSI